MNHRERIRAALRGESVDHVPVALWRHFPNDDLDAEAHAARVIDFQTMYDFDLVKVTPASGYPAEMYGATFVDGRNNEGTRAYTLRPINRLEDWDRVLPLDETNAVFQRETATLRRVRERLGPDVPVLQTIFGPLNAAKNMAGERMVADLRAHPLVLERALKAITETTIRFAMASLRAGADAIFYATQMATPKFLSRDEFVMYGEPYDLQVLNAIRNANPGLVLLHIHGPDVYFDTLAQWPVDVINWHDRRTAPTLADARSRFHGALAGGLDELDTLRTGSRDQVLAQARDAVVMTHGRGFILAAGCVTRVDTPEANIRAVLEAVRG